jgi:hypothetical protein
MGDFDDLNPDNIGTIRNPPLAEGFEYKIQITDILRKAAVGRGVTHIAEYTVTGSTGGSPVGTKSAYVRKEDADGYWKADWAWFLLAAMGVNCKDKSAIAQAFPFLEPVQKEALTKVKNPSLPVHLIGAELLVDVRQGSEPKPGKKYYPSCQYRALGT